MRIPTLLLAAGIALSPAVVSAAPVHAGCSATTSLGRVAGQQADDLCVFRGIPYAAPPTGELRFRPPQPVQPWQGTFPATDPAKVCPQWRDDQSEEYPDDRPVFTDEDCLRLNVWAPRTPGRHPVIVFSHGGAARFGTANEPRYDGSVLARTGDAVVVTVNYRLGVLGWAELGGVDPAYRGSGNNGLRDQIAALEWVRAHIAHFGGDPGNVTAVGESEGAFSLSAMLATEHPQRLFRRVVLQSGSGYMVHSPRLQRTFAERLNGRTIPELRAMQPVDLLQLQQELVGRDPLGGAIYFGPYVDGELVRAPVIDRVRAGHARGVDVLVGTNRDEINYFAQFDPDVLRMTQQEYDAYFPGALAGRRADILRVYQSGRGESEATLAMLTDQVMRVPATRLAEAQARWARTYVYRFDWAPPGGLGAVHTAELPFVFGTLRFTGIPGGAQALRADPVPLHRLAKRMTGAWTAFARSGDPGWPCYRRSRDTMVWDVSPRVVRAPAEAERAAWDGFDFPALDVN